MEQNNVPDGDFYAIASSEPWPEWVYGLIVCVGIPAAMALFAWVMR